MKVAIVSDPLVQGGGAERVVEAIADLFPEAPIYTIVYSAERGPRSLQKRIVESPLGRIPQARHRHRLFLPFYPAAIESFDLRAFDLIVSSHHTLAKGVRRHPGQVHISYCHTPMRALWERTEEELQTVTRVLRPLAAWQLRRLRDWDRATVDRVDAFIANGVTTQRRIATHYGRESTVIHPPIDTERFVPAEGLAPGDYYLVAARSVPYKRVDLAVAATGLAGRRLIVVGGRPGTWPNSPHVEFLGRVSDARLIELMQGARAFLAPQLEDFGMANVEVMACGRPVIAFARGGATETVLDGRTGVLCEEQTPQAFAAAIERLESLEFSSAAIRAHAETFSAAVFRQRFRAVVDAEFEARRTGQRRHTVVSPKS
jgi:glycosyltransferase involved in cell wall biosynthesis